MTTMTTFPVVHCYNLTVSFLFGPLPLTAHIPHLTFSEHCLVFQILCGKLSFLVNLPAELITIWSSEEGTAIPQSHRNHSSSNTVSHPRRLKLFSNITNITYISSISWPYMTKLVFSNDTEGHFSGSCSGVYKINYVIILHPSDGQW